MNTADISIQRRNPVDQPQFEQKVECPVNRGGSRPAMLLKHFENLVGSDRLVLLPDQLKNPATNCRKPLPVLLTNPFRILQGPGYTVLVIMLATDKKLFVPC